jgi:hypothetical protein
MVHLSFVRGIGARWCMIGMIGGLPTTPIGTISLPRIKSHTISSPGCKVTVAVAVVT